MFAHQNKNNIRMRLLKVQRNFKKNLLGSLLGWWQDTTSKSTN